MIKEERVSGNIFAQKDPDSLYGESYAIINPITNQGWGIPTLHITPEDLYSLARRMEENRRYRIMERTEILNRAIKVLHETSVSRLEALIDAEKRLDAIRDMVNRHGIINRAKLKEILYSEGEE